MTSNIEDNRPVKTKKVVEKDIGPDKRISTTVIKKFVSEVKVEFDKVAWPDKKHTAGSTVVVVVLVMIISFYLGGVDLLLGKLISLVLR